MSSESRVEVHGARDWLEHCLALESRFAKPPKVTLVLKSSAVSGAAELGVVDIAATTAIQCYAAGIAPMKPRPEEKPRKIAADTLEAGHHTTRMHAHFTWRLENVSRHAIHDYFHAYPYYNSEQQSQRYVEIRDGSYQEPTNLNEGQARFFLEACSYANRQYFRLLELLKPAVSQRVRDMYPGKGWNVERTRARLNAKIDKLIQEVARYVVQIGQVSTFDHTLSELQLLRLFHASKHLDFSDEVRFVIAKMVESVSKVDPQILTEIRAPLEASNENCGWVDDREFDGFSGGKLSQMVEISSAVRKVLAMSVRRMTGKNFSDLEALSFLMSPNTNLVLADVYETGMHEGLASALRQINLTFFTTLSHAADSQRQRHRRTAGNVPFIHQMDFDNLEYLTPLVIAEDPKLKAVYDEIIEKELGNVRTAQKLGISKRDALLLLPNALKMRVVESGDLFDWLHRWKQRLCYLAQEEIFWISLDQVEQLGKYLPEASGMLLAPCGVRAGAGVRPRCPEGDRWCGQPVYNWKIEEYKKHRLI